MIRLSRLSDYAIAIMCEIALKKDDVLSAKYLSEKTHISESTVMKLLKLLTKGKLLVSSRGIKGGYMINKDPHSISILDIVAAIDGPVMVTLCSDQHHTSCGIETTCKAKHGWGRVNNALAKTLSGFNLNDLANSSLGGYSHVS